MAYQITDHDRKVNETAYKLKFGENTPVQAEILKDRLGYLLFTGRISRYMVAENFNLVFTLAFNAALRDYGEKKDWITGELISFGQLFYAYFARKKPDLYKTHKTCRTNKTDKTEGTNSGEEIEEIIEVPDELVDTEGEETGGRLTDVISQKRYEEEKVYLDNLYAAIEDFLQKLAKREEKWVPAIRCSIWYKVLNDIRNEQVDKDFLELLPKEFLIYCMDNKTQLTKRYDFIAGYLGKKPDTVRKSIALGMKDEAVGKFYYGYHFVPPRQKRDEV